MSYTDYLQQREHTQAVTVSISEQTASLVGQSEAAAAAIESTITRGFETATVEIVQSLESLERVTREGFESVGSVLEWGFGEVVYNLRKTNDFLEEILKTLREPSQVWAFEQYRLANEQYQNGWYGEALESVVCAIQGHGPHRGLQTEWSFHFLKGMIRLGSFGNHSKDVVNLADAEVAFANSARYAEPRDKSETANALLCATRAATLQGKFKAAIDYGRRGLRFAEKAALHYELARALASVDEEQAAGQHLRRALELDRQLVVKACADPAFERSRNLVPQALAAHLSQLRTYATRAKAWLDAELRRVSSITYRSAVMNASLGLDPGQYGAIRSARQLADELARSGSKGILELRSHFYRLAHVHLELGILWVEYTVRASGVVRDEYDRRFRELEGARSDASAPEDPSKQVANVIVGIGALYSLWRVYYHFDRDGFLSGVQALFGYAIFLGIIVVIAHAVAAAVSNSHASTLKEAVAAVDQRVAALHEQLDDDRERLCGKPLYEVDESLRDWAPSWLTGPLRARGETSDAV
jgi:tetratricopeptide (TPR) repeat protein